VVGLALGCMPMRALADGGLALRTMHWIAEGSHAAISHAARAIAGGYGREPTAMLVLAGAAAVPMLALGLALRRAAIRRRQRRQLRATTAARLAEFGADSEQRLGAAATLHIAGQPGRSIAVGEIVRIGGGEDWDIALEDVDASVIEALIERATEGGFRILDVGVGGASRIHLNGQQVRAGELADGDEITIGRTGMVFRRSTVAHRQTGAMQAAARGTVPGGHGNAVRSIGRRQRGEGDGHVGQTG
jgi:hypothetical protein